MPDALNLNHLIPDSKKLKGTTISDLLENFIDFKDRVLILLDIETLGLNPVYDYEQITELAACSVSGFDYNKIDEINYKVKLSDTAKDLLKNEDSVQRFNWERRQTKRGKTAFTDPNEILKMTHYHELETDAETECNAIKLFKEFISKYDDPIIVAHNVDFDLNFICVRGNLYDIKLPAMDVFDTLKLSQYFFVPLVETLKKNETKEFYEKLLRETKKTKHISSRLGDLATALKIDSKMWHSANADIKMMRDVMIKVLDVLTEYKKIDISSAQQIAINKTTKKIRSRRKK